MQTAHHLGTRWLATGYGLSLISFAIMVLCTIDIFNITPATSGSTAISGYNAGKTYLFKIGYGVEFWTAIVALAAGVILAIATYYRSKE